MPNTRFSRDILTALSAANLAALIILWVCETVVGEGNWLTTLLIYTPQHPFALGAIVLGCGLLQIRRMNK